MFLEEIMPRDLVSVSNADRNETPVARAVHEKLRLVAGVDEHEPTLGLGRQLIGATDFIDLECERFFKDSACCGLNS